MSCRVLLGENSFLVFCYEGSSRSTGTTSSSISPSASSTTGSSQTVITVVSSLSSSHPAIAPVRNPGPLGLPLKTRQRALYHSKLVIYIYVYQLESTQPTSSSLSSSPPRSSAISPSRPFSTNKAFRADARFACLCAASAKRSSRLGVG